MWVEITTLLIPWENDDLFELKAEAEWLAKIDKNMPWHVTAFHPEYKMMDREPTPSDILIKANEIGKYAGLKHVYCGNIPNFSTHEATICPKCNKELISRFGFDLTNINIIEGKCRYCKEKISGVWK